MTDIAGLIERLALMTGRSTRLNYAIGDYWNAAEDSIDALAAQQERIAGLERELLFANDAAEKGTVARLAAGGMELTIAEQSATIAELREDAERYRWLKPYLEVARDEDSKWTCWLALQCIPYRSTTDSAEELLDRLIERFPLSRAKAGEKP